jgi:hypothetical protein
MNDLEKKTLYEQMAYDIINYIDCIFPGENRGNVYYNNKWDHYRNLVEHNEACIAFEDISDIIKDDLELTLPNDIYNKLVEVCKFFRVSPTYWQDILHE